MEILGASLNMQGMNTQLIYISFPHFDILEGPSCRLW